MGKGLRLKKYQAVALDIKKNTGDSRPTKSIARQLRRNKNAGLTDR